MNQNLELWFAKAKLPVKIEKDPLIKNWEGVNVIFQMDVDRRGKKKNKEYFRIYPGDKENEVRVLDSDPNHQQVILFVHEPKREFKVRVYNYSKRKYEWQNRKTPDFIRKYLLGMDECHLFISELDESEGPINQVKEAHRALKPQIVRKNEKNISSIKRQGEWFFIPATKEELNKIGENYVRIEKKTRIGKRGGNPHIADQYLALDIGVFVKGKICHPEHHTIKLHGWYRVEGNREARTTRNRIGFVD